MIRALLFVLALVAAVLAVVLKQPLLFVIAGVLVVMALAALVAYLRRRHRQAQVPYVSTTATRDELKELGILEIRPREGSSNRPPAVAPTGANAPDVKANAPDVEANAPEAEAPASEARKDEAPLPVQEAVPETPPPDDEDEDMLIEVKARNPARFVAVAAVAEGYDEDAILPVLQALRAAIGATTVCLMRQEEIALRYHILGIVSQNGYARSPGRFSSRTSLLPAGHAPVWVRRVHENDLPAKSLGYYREPIAVRRVALAPLALESTDLFLLADAMDDQVFESPRAQVLLAQGARLLGTLLGTERAPVDIPPPQQDTPRPRREIIAEEMTRARTRRHPLALALVYLEGHDPLRDASPEVIARTEADLKGHLHEIVPTARIERFGELMYGLFYREPLDDVEAWALGLKNSLDGAGFDGDIYVGVALLQERHQTADDFKQEATAALYEAYETGKCTIIES